MVSELCNNLLHKCIQGKQVFCSGASAKDSSRALPKHRGLYELAYTFLRFLLTGSSACRPGSHHWKFSLGNQCYAMMATFCVAPWQMRKFDEFYETKRKTIYALG